MYRLLFISPLLFLACEATQTNESSKQPTTKTDVPAVVQEVTPKIAGIDSLSVTELEHVRSLRWEKATQEGSEFIEVSAFVNADEFPLKLTEYFSEPGYGREGENFYYLENNQLIAVRSIYDEWIDSNTMQVVEQEHYFKNGKPTYSRIKRASFLDELPDQKWEQIRTEAPSIERAYKILKSEPPFTTTFISFIQGEESLFIVLGEPKDEDRFITALKIANKDPIIEKLYKNIEANKYKPLDISFEISGGNGYPEFRVLKDIEWAE